MNKPRTLQELDVRLTALRQIGDPLADKAFQSLLKSSSFFPQLQNLSSNSDLSGLVLEAPMDELLQDIRQKLRYFDLGRLEAGHQVFEKYAVPVMIILSMYSLPYCYAAEKGALVLVKSNYLLENPEKRLEETGEFLFATGSKEAFKESGSGIIQCLKVRLLHAGARFHAKIAEECSVNQEDLLGTNLAFSLIVIRGFQKMGISLGAQEQRDFLYLWQCIGELLGIEKDMLPGNVKEASLLERIIRKRQFRHSKAAEKLTSSLIELYRKNWPLKAISPEEVMVSFIGKEVSSCLGLSSAHFKEGLILGSLKMRNAFQHFSAQTFRKMMTQLERGQLSF